ncbi:gap-Pol polyprotein [Clonorchis sinensis]|uniref:Gap-Pol polyprotein n=1 Tax=Clonorchis sinensis TaxID=79923 RepID=G7Y7D6_CLOSI|nr:gap-Pol polyprotein [Clonorchis sinensis]
MTKTTNAVVQDENKRKDSTPPPKVSMASLDLLNQSTTATVTKSISKDDELNKLTIRIDDSSTPRSPVHNKSVDTRWLEKEILEEEVAIEKNELEIRERKLASRRRVLLSYESPDANISISGDRERRFSSCEQMVENFVAKVNSRETECPETSKDWSRKRDAAGTRTAAHEINGMHVDHYATMQELNLPKIEIDNGFGAVLITAEVAEKLGVEGEATRVEVLSVNGPNIMEAMTVIFTIQSSLGGYVVDVDYAHSIGSLTVIKATAPDDLLLSNSHEFLANEALSLIETNVPEAHLVIKQLLGFPKHPRTRLPALEWAIFGPAPPAGTRESILLRYLRQESLLRYALLLLCAEMLMTTDMFPKKGQFLRQRNTCT